MFGKYEKLRSYVPTFWMDLVEIPGNSVAEAEVRYTYRIPEQDNLWEYYMVLINRLRLLVDTPFKMNSEGFNIEDTSRFKVLREALVNLLMHSDHFSTVHSCIRVYTNRVEFFNAGSYPIPVEQLGNSLYSNPRNPIIAKFFRLAQLSETVGYGIDIMRNWKNLTGYKVMIDSDISTSTVTFYLRNDNVTDNVTNKRKSKYRLLQILELMKTDKNISISYLAEYFGISTRTIKRDINQLRVGGKLRRIGIEKDGYWDVIDE